MKPTPQNPGDSEASPRSAAHEPGLALPVFPAGSAGAAAHQPVKTAPLAAVLTRHILQDGEIILLILKPSLWFIFLSMLRFAAAVLIVMLAKPVFDEQLHFGPHRIYYEVGVFLLIARVMWAVLQWMSRLYILTDLRIVRLSGIFTLEIFDCPLRKLARTRILYTVRERLFRVGSIEIIPSDEEYPICVWQTVSVPVEINEQIVAAISRAKQGRNGV